MNRIQLFKPPPDGRITDVIRGDTPGRISYAGTTWPSRPYTSGLGITFPQGQTVRIVARKGNTLLIEPNTSQLMGA